MGLIKSNIMRNKKMATLVETMYSTREKPWHGLGVVVAEVLSSSEMLKYVGIDWSIVQ